MTAGYEVITGDSGEVLEHFAEGSIDAVVTRTCPVCGVQYEADPKRLKWGRQTTCSRECSYKLRAQKKTNGVMLICPVCDKEFRRTPAQLEKVTRGQPSCSQECAYKARQLWGPPKQYQLLTAQYAGGHVRITCIYCGKSVTRIPSQVRRGSTKYCSYGCFMADRNYQRGEANPSWRGGHERYYGPDWRPMQRAARDRDRHTCVRCGTTREEVGRELDVHHLRAVNTFDEANDANTLDNLVTLCHPCHMFIEWNGIDFTLPRGVTQCTTS